jgi:hypothetical protein
MTEKTLADFFDAFEKKMRENPLVDISEAPVKVKVTKGGGM